jgi:pimeloyl-ACP methyl ester carboxylesterase
MRFSATIPLAFLLGTGLALTAESNRFDSDGVSLRYLTGGSGETVVLLHGFSGSAEGLYIKPGTFDALVRAGYRVVALDQRGHGRSDKPYDAESYGMKMVEDVRRLLDHLDVDKVHLVGYSMGAKVSNTFRSKYPDRLLTITLGGYGWPWQSQTLTSPEAKERLTSRMVLPGNDLNALAAVSVASNILTPSEMSLRTNNVPAFAIIGDKDEIVSRENLEILKETMANLELVVMPGTHAGLDGAPYKPQFAEELIAFLAKHQKH